MVNLGSIPSMVDGWKHVGDVENQHQNGYNISNLRHLAIKLTPEGSEGSSKLVKEESDWSHYSKDKCLDCTFKNSDNKTKLNNPIVHATETGIIEMERTYYITVEQKNRILYDYLKKKSRSQGWDAVGYVDNDGNTVLHLAANSRTSPKVVLGHLNQMTWDVC
ncbi:unnamed protein product [Camellia sinensis]